MVRVLILFLLLNGGCQSKQKTKTNELLPDKNKKLRVVQCWDDSPNTDIQLVELLRKYNAKATFNIIPMDKRKLSYVKKKKTGHHVLFSFLQKDESSFGGYQYFHMANEEMADVYKGFKVAAHGRIPLGNSKDDSLLRKEILKNTKDWILDEFGQEKVGFVYPGGNFSLSAKKDIEDAGYLYGRTTKSTLGSISLRDPFLLSTSCHWASPDFWMIYDKAKQEGGIFYFWGHSVELGDDPMLWKWLESIFNRISDDEDSDWADIIDLF